MIEVEINNAQSFVPPEVERWQEAIRSVLDDAHVDQAGISLAVVDDPTIHELNRRFLDHDCPTDVITFPLADGATHLEGEIVASGQTAKRAANELGCLPGDELLLYIVHGALHLVGYDDKTQAGRHEMRAREREVLTRFGVRPTWDEHGVPVTEGATSAADSSEEGESRT